MRVTTCGKTIHRLAQGCARFTRLISVLALSVGHQSAWGQQSELDKLFAEEPPDVSAVSPLVGTEWCCRTLSGRTGTLVFREDGTGDYDDGDVRDGLTWTASSEREAVGKKTRGGKLWFTAIPGGWQLESRSDAKDGMIRVLWYRGKKPPPPFSVVQGVLAEAGVLWHNAEKLSTYTFKPDGTFTGKWSGGGRKGKWLPWYGDVVLVVSEDDTSGATLFALVLDGAEIWHSRVGGSAWSRRGKGGGTTTGTGLSIPEGAALAVRTEFAALERQYAEAFSVALEKQDVRDATTLDALKKRAGVADLDILQAITSAQEAVAAGAPIPYALSQKMSPAGKELAQIKAARDRAITAAARSAALRVKPAYAACFRKAAEAGELDLAKWIKAKQDAMAQ